MAAMFCLGLRSVLLAAVLLGAARSLAVAAPAADFDITHGHFFTEGSGTGQGGFSLIDDSDAPMWSEFQRLGGVQSLGFPLSRRFSFMGFVAQVTQRGVLQWHPELQQVELANLLDLMHEQPHADAWLQANALTPPPDSVDETGRSFAEIESNRLSWLDADSEIKQAYFLQGSLRIAADPVLLWGLPTSSVAAYPEVAVVRTQRAVFQHWKHTMPWTAGPDQVTIALSGQLGIDSGFLKPFFGPETLLAEGAPN